MNRWSIRLGLAAVILMALPYRSPAPLIYTPGEGWTYESVGEPSGNWRRTKALAQLVVAQDAFDRKDYSLALNAARRTVTLWPLSDYAPQAQYLIGRCYEANKHDEKAFDEYQKIFTQYPRYPNYEDVLGREYEISGRFLAGQWFRLWNLIPLYPSMEKTAALYAKVVKNGPYSSVGPQAQMKIGAAREKQKNYAEAVKAYERAADRYNDRPQIAADALYRAGIAYQKQAQTAEYDQGMAGKAMATFEEFKTLYPDDPRVPGVEKIETALRIEQKRGNFVIAQYYESQKKWEGAKVYYNAVLANNDPDPNSSYSVQARERIAAINRQHPATVQ